MGYKMRVFLILVAILGVLSGVCGAQSNQSTPASSLQGPNAYILGPSDQIVIRASNAPDISDKAIRIDLEGNINMPMIGRVHAAGLTVPQLEEELLKRLKVYFEEPEVAVSITEFQSQPVTILGAVGAPGVHQLEGHKTLVEILAVAGGVRPDGGPVVRITRQIERGRLPLAGATDDPTGKYSIADVEIRPLIDAKTPEKNILILPYDVITVPQAETVFVMGEVNRAGPLTLSSGHSISILEALATSGGTMRTASLSHSLILRTQPNNPKREEVPVDLKKILRGRANDQALLAGDILYVPGSTAKRVTARALEAVTSLATMAVMYGVIY